MVIPQYVSHIIDNMRNTDYNGDMYHKHLAVLVRHKKPVTPFKFNFLNTYSFKKVKGSIHAEMHSLKWYLSRISCYKYQKSLNDQKYLEKLQKKSSNLIIIVVRLKFVDGDVVMLNSKPCVDCIDTLKILGCKSVYYSTGDADNPIKMEYLKDIDTEHVCAMRNYIRNKFLI